jgi:lipid II:glycine glycyltransferase (peptidoglycan interpeptide bridge formation enzyme)
MAEWLASGAGALIGARQGDTWLGFIYLYCYKAGAYYGSACNDYEAAGNLPVSHVLHWTALEYLKARGLTHYELGGQQFGPQLFDFPSEKQLAIAFFKRGFGGGLRPLFIGEKFYSSSLFRRVYGARVERYATHLESGAYDLGAGVQD